MRDSSSVRLIWSRSLAPPCGGFGSLPRGFLPSLRCASRRATLASYSFCSSSNRSCARASIFAFASANALSRASRRASSAGTSIPSGRLCRSAFSAIPINCCTSSRNFASIRPICPYDSARCLLAFAFTLVPSSAMRPSLTSFISLATSSTCTNSFSIRLANRLRKVASVSWSGCVFAAM
ncbi:hypothetical protein R69746_08859 [Paraburkholderia aspalathi]|nr:hypothetical protein R75465_08641 [Paraburkholderia aspalathi]CAE6877491.1 hypothetical protein R69746_08859 [Paraburkholderia aspalathi]